MMKKIISVLLLFIIVLSTTACSGNLFKPKGHIDNVKISDYSSEIYTDDEIKDAIDVTLEYFKNEFYDCTLTELSYLGDEWLTDYQTFATRENADDVIVFISNFDTGSSGGDGSLNPNDTYENWSWILVRENGGQWRHVDHGY